VQIEPILSGFEALPPRYRRRNARLPPFGMAWRLIELVDLREERIDKFGDPSIPIAILWLIVGYQQRAGSKRLNLMPLLNQIRILFAAES